MAKTRTRRGPPDLGAVVVFPLEDGRCGACRVLQRGKHLFGKDGALFELTRWIGDAPPALDEPALREPLLLTHHSWSGSPDRVWIDGPLPKGFRVVGILEPSAADRAVECLSTGFLEDFANQRLMQWRWEHDREAVLAEDAVEEEAEAPPPKPVSLSTLRRRKPLKELKGVPGVEEARAALRESLQGLADLGRRPGRAAVLEVIQAGVERFNALDGDVLEITTFEREAIAEWFNLMARACGVTDLEDVTERWRDW